MAEHLNAKGGRGTIHVIGFFHGDVIESDYRVSLLHVEWDTDRSMFCAVTLVPEGVEVPVVNPDGAASKGLVDVGSETVERGSGVSPESDGQLNLLQHGDAS